jgi:hypothetical protein
MGTTGIYQARQFDLSGLKGISDQTLEMHFNLYEGYVKETNNLTERINEFVKDGNVDQEELPAYSELTRRLGFEYNGMVLHEYYFDNMIKGGGTGDPDRTSQFVKDLESRLCGHREDARSRLGHLLPESGEWAFVEPLDHVARDGERCGVHADPRDGRVGARVFAGLQTSRAAEVHRGVLLEYRVGRS